MPNTFSFTVNEEEGNVHVFDLSGDMLELYNKLGDRVNEIIGLTHEKPKIVFNFELVTKLHTSGLPNLIGTITKLKSKHARLKVVKLVNKPRQVVKTANLLGLIDEHESVEEAVAAF